ncbi:Aldehyde dehydrogenase family 2 member B7, mitochondrial [Capsicum baccatum]|uniref:Aldehyde dehydrogenase family 2 member B7, mitochondrial n=1 Tax=Capsicum baccatum TaxID=33114 RepID=A0A2G2WJH5_CAPBA|nr:Aldehyde dehydrogenase family 2 member B7, mitochondrial [Capsicum baccatum]
MHKCKASSIPGGTVSIASFARCVMPSLSTVLCYVNDSADEITPNPSLFVLLHFADMIEKHNDQIVMLEIWDTGRPYEQAAKTESTNGYASQLLCCFAGAGWVDKIHGLTIPANGSYHDQTLQELIEFTGQTIS